jgi:hypothetical protein
VRVVRGLKVDAVMLFCHFNGLVPLPTSLQCVYVYLWVCGVCVCVYVDVDWSMTLHQDTSFCATLRHSQECILTYRHPVHHSKRKYVLSSFAKVGITSILTHTHAHLRILTHTHMHKKVHILAVCTAAASFALLRSVTVGNIKTHRHVLMHTFTTSTH